MQHDIMCEEQDLKVLHLSLQQMNPGDPQYVRVTESLYHYNDTVTTSSLIVI